MEFATPRDNPRREASRLRALLRQRGVGTRMRRRPSLLVGLAALLLGGVTLVVASGAPDRRPWHLSEAGSADASLAIRSPAQLRSNTTGDIHLEIRPRRSIARPVVELPRQWLSGISLTAVRPALAGRQQTEHGTRLYLPSMLRGERFDIRLSYRVDAGVHGLRSGPMRLLDGDRLLAEIPADLLILP